MMSAINRHLRIFFLDFKLPIIISLAAISVQLAGPSVQQLLRYEMFAVGDGQWWRLISANFVHSNSYHLLLNLSGLWLMDYLFQRDLNFKQRASLLTVCMIGNVLLLHCFYHLIWYVGLSGALHGYLVGNALQSWKSAKITNSLIVGIVLAKVIVESNWEINQSTAKLIGANVVEQAHAMGVITALVYVAILLLSKKWLWPKKKYPLSGNSR